MMTKAKIIFHYMAELAVRRRGTKNAGVAAYWARMSIKERTTEMKRATVRAQRKEAESKGRTKNSKDG